MQSEQERELKAIHASDLSDLLQKFEIYDKFTNSEITCNVCEDIISNKNVGSIQKLSGKLLFTCNKPTCYNKVVKTTKE